MWKARTKRIPSGMQFRVRQDHTPMSFRNVFTLLESSDDFARWYRETLANTAYKAFFWEFPPLTVQTFDSEAEFVLIESVSLARLRPDPAPFQSQFAARWDSDVIVFPNLGGDAVLIVPAPLGPHAVYPHLASFLRSGPEQQICSLLKNTARVVRENLSHDPRWLSTAGLGVSWLHVRLDTRPKYYNFVP